MNTNIEANPSTYGIAPENVNDDIVDMLAEKVGLGQADYQELRDRRQTDWLRRLGGDRNITEDIVVHHDKPSIALPQDMDEARGSVVLAEQARSKTETVSLPQKFLARPDDGGVAFMTVLKAVYGFAPKGVKVRDPFTGEVIFPEFRQVKTGVFREEGGRWVEETVSVPKSLMLFSNGSVHFTFTLGETVDEDYGLCFFVNVQTNKGSEAIIKGLFKLVEAYISETSLYRGKVLEGVGRVSNGRIVEPKFVNVDAIRSIPLFFAAEVSTKLRLGIRTFITHTDLHRARGHKIGRTVILAGEPGTGKSEEIIQDIKLAMANRETVTICPGTLDIEVERSTFTSIIVKPEEDFNLVTKFAQSLGGPVILVMEDSEYRTEFRDRKQRTKFLNDLDGIGSKGSEVMKIFTTNKPEAFEDETGAVFRAERVDAFIVIGLPDKEAVFGMVCAMVPEHLREGEYDADALWEYSTGYTLAWVSGAVKDASIAAVDRTGDANAKISQQDILDALVNQRETHGRYLNARAGGESTPAERLGEALADVLGPSVEHRVVSAMTERVYDGNGSVDFHNVSERGEDLIEA